MLDTKKVGDMVWEISEANSEMEYAFANLQAIEDALTYGKVKVKGEALYLPLNIMCEMREKIRELSESLLKMVKEEKECGLRKSS